MNIMARWRSYREAANIRKTNIPPPIKTSKHPQPKRLWLHPLSWREKGIAPH